MSKKNKIIVVGAGLCGSLLAVRLAQRGFEVCLYEKLPDMRKTDLGAGRSINLALSNRGLMALDRVGLKEDILDQCIPMLGRIIHPIKGDTFLSRYSGREEDYINSVSRPGLNIELLNLAEANDNISVRFNCKCLGVELETATATFQDKSTGETFSEKGDIVIGTDGAGSAVRRSLMAKTAELLFDFSQSFLRTGYKELSILPDDNDNWRIHKEALHIWPRGHHMVIALPNLDGSFTLTMFHPYEGEAGFNTLNTKAKVTAFFEKYYPDLIPHCPHFADEYFENPTGILGTIKCYPWQAYGKVLIMGDAAHAIVPFYGQGMNAAFEDVRVLDDVMNEHGDDWEKVFTNFQDLRAENANAIADLAIDNFYEMQDRVDDEDFIKKRKIEMKLEIEYPDYFSKYSLVTFRPDLDYKKAMKLGREQDALLLKICTQPEFANITLEEIHQKMIALKQSMLAGAYP
ncbi:MAG: NAD(P)/FAD-dependent oxidoreductase [Bacteroidota bacterium]